MVYSVLGSSFVLSVMVRRFVLSENETYGAATKKVSQARDKCASEPRG